MDIDRPCVNSGYCCKQAPCPFGSWNAEKHQCNSLKGDKPGNYECEKYDFIMTQPYGREVSPAFGAGCCSPLNTDRRELIQLAGKEE